MISIPSLVGAPVGATLAVPPNLARASVAAAGGNGLGPVNLAAPNISGTAQEGQILIASSGAWSGNPTSFTYQWKRAGTVIAGSSNATRTLTSADIGAALSCTVTAANARGTASADTANTVAVIAASVPVPVNIVAPAVTGTGTVGQVLTTDNGTWSNSPTSYTYAWRRGGVDIAGATALAYTLVQADVGVAVTCRVFATNTGGTAGASSNAVTVAAPPANTAPYTPSVTTPGMPALPSTSPIASA